MRPNQWNWAGLAAAAGGGLLSYTGWKFGAYWLFHIGLIFISLSVLGFGIEAVLKREDTYQVGDTEGGQSESYYGFAAVMSGVFLALIGLGILAYAVVALLGLEEAFPAFFRERPGLMLLFAGSLVASFSFTLILGASEDRASVWALLGSLPGRLFGVLLLLAGLIAIGLGILEMMVPAGFDRLMQFIGEWMLRNFE